MNQWDEKIISLGGGVLQSQAWADFQESIGRGLVRQSGDGWAWQGFIRSSKGIRYLFLPYGPVVQSNADEALRAIIFNGEEQGCDFVRCEPVGSLTGEALRQVRGRQISEVEPQHTLILDLTKDETELRHGLQSGHRNRINTASKRGVVVEVVADMAPVDDFLRLMNETARHAHIINYPDSYYVRMAEVLIDAGQAVFYVSRVAGKVASVSLVYDFGSTRYYAFTGNDQQLNREHKVAVSAVWQMIIDAKAKDLTRFDFWGVAPDDNPDHKWAGITAFKKGFGGERIATIGTWDIPIKQTKYRAYSLYRKLRG